MQIPPSWLTTGLAQAWLIDHSCWEYKCPQLTALFSVSSSFWVENKNVSIRWHLVWSWDKIPQISRRWGILPRNESQFEVIQIIKKKSRDQDTGYRDSQPAVLQINPMDLCTAYRRLSYEAWLSNYLPRKQNPHRSSMIYKQHVNSISLIIKPKSLAVPAVMSISSFYRHFISLYFQNWCNTTHLLVTAVKTSPISHLPKGRSSKILCYNTQVPLDSLSSNK